MRKKPNLIPRMERCADYLVTDPQQWRGRWREKGTPGCELRLELGCGKGRFTCETAAAEPDVLFVAVERVPDAMVIAMERAKAAGLNNVFFIDADVARLTEFFAPGEVERIYLNFCDPGPPTAMQAAADPRKFLRLSARCSPRGGRSTSRRTTAGCSNGRCSSSTGGLSLGGHPGPAETVSCGVIPTMRRSSTTWEPPSTVRGY
jgi:tRNA (guanine-N7-)-methyltransferase